MSLDVTLVMPTYGRHKNLTEETIYGFLQQTYKNVTLLILNTHKDKIIFDTFYPNIEVIESPDIFETVGDKYCHLFSLVKTSLFGILEDDDYIMPTHVESLVNFYLERKYKSYQKLMAVNNRHSIFTEKNIIQTVEGPSLWWTYLYENNSEFLEYSQLCSKFPGFDLYVKDWHKWNKFEMISTPTYVYRWDTGSRHLSGWGSDKMIELMKLCQKEANAISNTEPWVPQCSVNFEKKYNDFVNKNRSSK